MEASQWPFLLVKVKQRSCEYKFLLSFIWSDRESNPFLPFQLQTLYPLDHWSCSPLLVVAGYFGRTRCDTLHERRPKCSSMWVQSSDNRNSQQNRRQFFAFWHPQRRKDSSRFKKIFRLANLPTALRQRWIAGRAGHCKGNESGRTQGSSAANYNYRKLNPFIGPNTDQVVFPPKLPGF